MKSYVGYRIRHRKQREVSKENEFYMQLLHLALPNDDPSQDELISQMRQAPELLRSDKLGDIDLPVSSAIIAQRIQQQQLLSPISLSTRERGPTLCWTPSQVASSSTNTTTTTTTMTGTTTRKPTFTNAKHVVANGQSMNGGVSTLSSAPMSTAPPSGSGSMSSLTSTATNNTMNFLQHTSLSHASGSAITQNGAAAHHHNNIHNNNNNHHQHNHHTNSSAASSAATTPSTSLTSILTYRNNRRSVDRSDKCNNDPASPTSRTTSNGLNNNLKSSDTTTNTTTITAAGHSKSRPNVAAPSAGGTTNNIGHRMSFFREAGRITETITSSIYSIKHKVFGSAASGHHTNDAIASSVNALTAPMSKHMNQQRNGSAADTSESHSASNTSSTNQAINSVASTPAISNAHSSAASPIVATSSPATSLSTATNTLHATQMPPTKNASFAVLSTNSGTSKADAPTTMGSGYKETRNNDCHTNNHHQQQQQHNNGLPNGTGKEKSNAKLNGNIDYELNSHQISHSHNEHHVGNGEIVEKNRGKFYLRLGI